MSNNEYGYIPKAPTQSFRNNDGVFSVNDVKNLIDEGKWTTYGQLELIETQTVSGVSAINFTSIKESTYNVHFLTYSNTTLASGNNQIGMRFYDSGTLETSTVYQWALERAEGSSFSEQRSTGYAELPVVWYALGTNTGANANGYAYLYNLGNSYTYSSMSSQSQGWYYNDGTGMSFGGGVLPQQSIVDGIQIAYYGGTVNISGTFSLYGIKEYS